MPVAVVEGLEVVDVDHHEAQRLLAVLSSRHLTLEHRPHPVTVAEPRQRIGICVALRLAQHTEAARDVFVVGTYSLGQHYEQILAERMRAIDETPEQRV